MTWGEQAVAGLSELTEPYENARARLILTIHSVFFHLWHIEEPEKKNQERLKNVESLCIAVELSERVEDAYLAGLLYWCLGYHSAIIEEEFQLYRKALRCGEETRDIFLKGLAQDWLAFRNYWKSMEIEDPEQRTKAMEDAMEFYDKSQRYSSIMLHLFRDMGVICPPGGYAEHYYTMFRYETDINKKMELLEKSEKDGLKALKIAEDLDMPVLIDQMCHYLSKTLLARASMEPDRFVKGNLLDKAMKLRERCIKIEERLRPFQYWRLGMWYSYLAIIKRDLADVEPDLADKRRLLEEAVSIGETCFEKIDKALSIAKMSKNFIQIHRLQYEFGETLTRLFEVTKEPRYLRRAIEFWNKSIESAGMIEMFSRMAESYWKIGNARDALVEHLQAADNFRYASDCYLKAAEKIPQLKGFYTDHATYMQAWSELEIARHNHKAKRYGEAKKHYEKAAELHQNTERWSYLYPNYLAWARLEEAEDLSRTEQTQKALNLFQQTTKLFSEAKESIKTRLKTGESGDERRIVEDLVKASDARHEYCQGRAVLEEARILDRQGDHATSSIRYGQATERFKRVMKALHRESDRRELRLIVFLSQAWEKMMKAEAQTSPSLYSDAAEFFKKAREQAVDQTTSLLAQANSSFCRALEAGAKFELQRDERLFTTAKNHIEAATNYYLRAGLESASQYANATSKLLGAYMYTSKAQTEQDPVGRARFYQMAERLLQTSASSYLKAKHPEKCEEVQRILKRIKEEREIAMALTEVLHIPSIASTTTSFSTPNPSFEQAVGLDRFEYADVQANIILGRREVNLGEDIELEIELVNAGKAPAQLIKVEEIITENFEIKRAPDICRIEDSYLNLKGRTLPPLQTEELRLVLKPLNKGIFFLKPRILYLDESGKYKFHEPEPAIVKVYTPRLRGPPI